MCIGVMNLIKTVPPECFTFISHFAPRRGPEGGTIFTPPKRDKLGWSSQND
jgi:hypothetical protein